MKSNLYTLTGDAGTTSLATGKRVAKCDTRIEAYGSVDELNSQIALLLAVDDRQEAATRQLLLAVQNKLFNIGAYLATDTATQVWGLTPDDLQQVERAIDRLDEAVPPLRTFVLPGGCAASAQADVCRTTARRAERRIIALRAEGVEVDALVLKYVNRLSDFFFALARFSNVARGIDEIFWQK